MYRIWEVSTKRSWTNNELQVVVLPYFFHVMDRVPMKTHDRCGKKVVTQPSSLQTADDGQG